MTSKELDSAEELVDQAKDWMDDARASDATKNASKLMSEVEKLPDTTYVAAVLGSIGLSLLLFLFKKQTAAIFVGLWPPTLASMAWLMKERRPSRELS